MVRKQDTLRTVADLLHWEPLLSSSQRAALLDVPCPTKVLGVRVPASLDGLTFEQLSRLWDIHTTADLFLISAEVLLGKPAAKVLRAPVLPLLGLANMVGRELERINGLWSSIPKSHNPEEVMAGVESLSFGVFGIADWYARRMRINDHDAAFATPWVRIYQCMLNDALEGEYKRRLKDIIARQSKRK